MYSLHAKVNQHYCTSELDKSDLLISKGPCRSPYILLHYKLLMTALTISSPLTENQTSHIYRYSIFGKLQEEYHLEHLAQAMLDQAGDLL